MSNETTPTRTKRHRLTNIQQHQLYSLVMAGSFAGDYAAQARKASRLLGFKVNEHHIAGARKQLGLGTRRENGDKNADAFIRDLKRLLRKHNIKP